MIFEAHDLAGAVFLFSEGRELIREMNYSEFEALLDGYVPAMDLANRELYAAYTEINSYYQVKNAVFFIVRFTTDGFIEQTSSVPLFRLANHAPQGPDIGYGPIGWVTESQCPIKQYASFLWEPDLDSKNELNALVDAVKRNRMSIQFLAGEESLAEYGGGVKGHLGMSEQAITEQLKQKYDQELRDKLEKSMREHQQKESMLMAERSRALAELKQQYNDRITEYREMVEEHKILLQDARERNQQMKDTIDGQAEKIQGLREYFEHKIEKAENVGVQEFEELKRSHMLEIEAAVDVATSELNEMLQMREVEILYRNDQEAKLHEELERLRSENDVLRNNSSDLMLNKMLEHGISFVTYQPGAGHITLPVSEIDHFMESPTAYVADYCGVTEEHYSAWLEHYHVPVCQSVGENASMCGENISRVESPADFVIGQSDCCHKHRKDKTPHLKLAGGA